MSELCAYDLDDTIRPGSLFTDAVQHGIEAGFMDPARFEDTCRPSNAEINYFIEALKHRSRHDFRELTDRLSDMASEEAFPWAMERMESQSVDGHVVILSHSPDFLVRAFARGLPVVKRGRGSHFHTSGLVFSGKALTLHKPTAAQRYIREQKLMRFAFAAGDTHNDVSMLLRAEHGVVVNPDEALLELADTHGWEIVRTDEAA